MTSTIEETLVSRYETGVAIKKTLGCPRSFGDKPAVESAVRERMMEEHGLSSDQFYKVLDFAFLYTRSEFDKLSRRRNRKSQQPLGWTHVRALLTFTRAELTKRTELESMAVEHGWSTIQLWEAARKARGGSKRTKGGPQFKYKDLLRWANETHRFLAGLLAEEDMDGNAKQPEIDRVLRHSLKNPEDRQELADLTAAIGKYARKVSAQSRKK